MNWVTDRDFLLMSFYLAILSSPLNRNYNRTNMDFHSAYGSIWYMMELLGSWYNLLTIVNILFWTATLTTILYTINPSVWLTIHTMTFSTMYCISKAHIGTSFSFLLNVFWVCSLDSVMFSLHFNHFSSTYRATLDYARWSVFVSAFIGTMRAALIVLIITPALSYSLSLDFWRNLFSQFTLNSTVNGFLMN